MKPHRVLSGIAIALLFLAQNGSSTILTGTMLTGFMGGFLMGKITLGTFLTILSQFNRPQSTTAGTARVPAKTSTSLNQIAGGSQILSDIPTSVDTQVRDRFLRQLGKMDPLNCLPKVFCEISSDPEAAGNLFGSDSMFPFSTNGQGNLYDLQTLKSKSTKKKNGNKNADQVQDDNGDDDDSDSQSDEYEDDGFKEYRKKEEFNLESKALDEMIEEFDDPINYYFILKDKQKNIPPELYGMIKNDETRRSLGPNSQSTPVDTIMKRIGEVPADSSVETDTKVRRKRPSSRSSTADAEEDIFADDPFFDDFGRSMKFHPTTNDRLIQVAQLRRSKRDIADEDEIMIQYRMAARVAEKYKNPMKCRTVFSRCPFSSEEVMAMVNEMNSNQKGKKPTKENNDGTMENMKNTLLAIEKLNSATMQAKSSGTPIDYGKVMEEALQSSPAESSATSTKIMEDFEGFTDQMKLQSSKKKIKNLKKSKSNSNKRLNKKKTVRRRRHGEMPTHVSQGLNDRRVPRISLTGYRSASNLQVDDNHKKHLKQLNSDEEVAVEPKIHNLGEFVAANPSTAGLDGVKDVESRVYKSDETEEDDELTFVGSEKPSKVPTFSQTYVETLQSPTKVKSRPRPVYPLVKVKPYQKRTTTSRPGTSTTTLRPRRPAPQFTQKFSGELEDDEEEAKNSEDAIDALLAKIKPKDKKSKP